MNNYHKKVESLKKLQIVLFIACIIAAGVFVFVITRPVVTKHSIKDDCGPIGGSISHSIDDVDSCQNACAAYCLSLKKSFVSSEFIEKNLECNICDCNCKK